MAIELNHGFFDSIDPNGNDPGDERYYQAADFARRFNKAFATGVWALDDGLKVVPTALPLTVGVTPGYAMLKGYDMQLKYDGLDDNALYMLALETPQNSYRIDRIVLRLDTSYTATGRYIKPVVLKGVEGADTPPELRRSGDIYELSLAQVIVRPGISAITEADITDERADAEVSGYIASSLPIDVLRYANCGVIPNITAAKDEWALNEDTQLWEWRWPAAGEDIRITKNTAVNFAVHVADLAVKKAKALLPVTQSADGYVTLYATGLPMADITMDLHYIKTGGGE